MPDDRTIIFRNGRVYTANPKAPWVEALAIRGSRVLAAGRDTDVRREAGNNIEEIDLGLRMAMPGVIDMHNHVLEGAIAQLFELVVKPSYDFDAVLGAVRKHAGRTPAGQWIIGAGWGPGIAEHFATEQGLRRLDEACPSHPVVLKDISYHSRIANSRAIAAAGIAALEGAARPGEIARDPESGKPTGLLHEAAAAAIDAAAPAWSDDHLRIFGVLTAVARKLLALCSWTVSCVSAKGKARPQGCRDAIRAPSPHA